jgi:hypothetical protein
MRKHVAKLRLPTGPYEEHDQLPRDIESDLMPMVFLDERERKVDACRDSR